MSAAMMLPGMEPSPPTITMAKALTIGSRPIEGCTVRNGETRMLASAAVPAEMAMTIEKMRLVGMPIYCAASGSCDTASIAAPSRVR